MNPNDFKRFGVFMSILQETFSPDKPISKQRTKIYFETLSDIPIENIELGVKELRNKKTFPIFPVPAEIRKAAGFADEDILDLRALEAFRETERFLPHHALGEKLPISDPYLEKAVVLCFGSWEALRNTDPGNETWDRKYFVEVYKKLIQADKRDKLLSTAELMKQLEENREKMKTLEEKK